MTRPFLTVAMLGACFASGGCASLKVQVDVMDPTYARAAGARAEITRGGHMRANRFIDASRANLRAFRSNCYDILIRENNAKPQNAVIAAASQSLQSARNDASLIAKIDTFLNPLRNTLYNADDTAVSAVAAASLPAEDGKRSKGSGLSPLEAALAKWESAYGVATATIANAVERNVVCPQPDTPRGQAELRVAEQQSQQSIQAISSVVGNGVLLNNLPEAFAITGAPDRYWAPRYNRAFGQGQFGSSSIAVKLNDTANFSIKGFVFDGRSTADMVKKIGIQAVTTVAAAYGAPVGFAKSSTPGTSGSATIDSAALLATPQSTVLAADAKTQAYRFALFQIADAVMANWDDLTKSDANAEQIVDKIADAQAEPYVATK